MGRNVQPKELYPIQLPVPDFLEKPAVAQLVRRSGKLLLVVASTAILGCGSRGTHDHIFLSHDSAQLVKKFPVFYGNRRFIIILVRVCHWTVSRASAIESHGRHQIFLGQGGKKSWVSTVGKATRLRVGRPMNRRSISGRSKKFSPQRPHWLCSPPRPLSSGYRWLSPG
jgi:hypothetical protein